MYLIKISNNSQKTHKNPYETQKTIKIEKKIHKNPLKT
jgi:hypothetical protein